MLSGADVLVDRRFLEPSDATSSQPAFAGAETMTLEAAVDAALNELRLPSRPVS